MLLCASPFVVAVAGSEMSHLPAATLGMTGAAESVIGMDARLVIAMFKGEKVKMDIADSKNAEINAVFLVIDEQSGKAISVERIRMSGET